MVPYVRVHVAAAAASLVWLVVPVPFVFRRQSRQVTPADRPVEMAALAPSALASTVAAASIVVVLVLVPPAAGGCDAMKDVVVREDAGHLQSNRAKKYTVVVTNTAGVPVSGIHLYCGYNFRTFSGVDAKVIVLVKHGDCVLLGGGAIAPGGNVTFKYVNYIRYDMKLLAATCDDGGGVRRPL